MTNYQLLGIPSSGEMFARFWQYTMPNNNYVKETLFNFYI